MNLTNIIKYNRIIYNIYYHTMSLAINALKVFVKPKDSLILINSFAGRSYNDSPKAVYDVMRCDNRFKGVEFVWAFHEPKHHRPEIPTNGATLRVVKTNSIDYFVSALSARVWLTNSSIERGLRFKGKKTFYLNTWHGTPLKHMGVDIATQNQSFRARSRCVIDIMLSQSTYETEIFSKAFGLSRYHFLECGLPRNDILATYTQLDRGTIRERLGIPADKTVVLYCPTFREYVRGRDSGVVMAPPIDLKKWELVLGKTHVLMIRAHYEVSKVMGIHENGFVRNVTSYPDLSDLFIASDVLISDYSSVFFDYSIMGKPMLHFTYDFEEYASERGMYFDIREWVSGGSNEDELISLLTSMDVGELKQKTVAFREAYVNYYGNAAETAANRILREMTIS